MIVLFLSCSSSSFTFDKTVYNSQHNSEQPDSEEQSASTEDIPEEEDLDVEEENSEKSRNPNRMPNLPACGLYPRKIRSSADMYEVEVRDGITHSQPGQIHNLVSSEACPLCGDSGFE